MFGDLNYSNWEQVDGWFFWNFKSEKEDNWSYFKLVENKWVPQNARTFPNGYKVLNAPSNMLKKLRTLK